MTDKDQKPAAASQPASAAAATAPRKGGAIDTKIIQNLGVSLEAFVGEARMSVGELSALGEGSVVPLESGLNQSVELRLNGVAVARGELVAVGDHFAVRLTEIAK